MLIALGSNGFDDLARSAGVLVAAIDRLGELGLVVTAQSRIYHTEAVPKGSGPDYANAAVVVATSAEPPEVLALLHQIEAEFGRLRAQRWGPRILDLDLLADGRRVLPDVERLRAWMTLPLTEQMVLTPDELLLPHPRMQDRAFVLVPLAEVAPDWRHPVLGKSVAELRDALPKLALDAVIPLANQEIRP